MSGVVEIVPGAFNLLPAHGHVPARGIHVIFAAVAVCQPAGEHLAVLVQIIVFSVDLLPAGEHHAGAGVQVIPGAVDLPPAEGAAPVLPEIIPVVVDGPPAGNHGAVALHIVVIVPDVDPAVVDHGAVIGVQGVEVIILAVHQLPAHGHLAGGFKIIVFPVDLFPAGGHMSGVQIHVVIFIVRGVNPALVVGAVVIDVHVAGAVQLPRGGLGRDGLGQSHETH